jgi:chromosome segregation ATPase
LIALLVGHGPKEDNVTQASSIEPQDTQGPIVVYQFTVEELRHQLAQYAGAEFSTPSQYREGVKAIAVCRSLRGEIEAKRKDLKADALEYGRRVDVVAKQLVVAIEEVELPLKERKAVVDDEKERLKREKEEAERAAREEELRVQREAEEAKLRAEREAAETRIAEERAALAAERQKLAQDQARLRAEREADEARFAAEREAEKQTLAHERRKLEAERRAIEEQRRQAELEELERQTIARTEQEARERAAREAIEAEEARVQEAERQAALSRRLEALKPDKARALDYLDRLLSVDAPSVSDAELSAELEAVRITLTESRESIAGIGGDHG